MGRPRKPRGESGCRPPLAIASAGALVSKCLAPLGELVNSQGAFAPLRRQSRRSLPGRAAARSSLVYGPSAYSLRACNWRRGLLAHPVRPLLSPRAPGPPAPGPPVFVLEPRERETARAFPGGEPRGGGPRARRPGRRRQPGQRRAAHASGPAHRPRLLSSASGSGLRRTAGGGGAQGRGVAAHFRRGRRAHAERARPSGARPRRAASADRS